MSKKFQHTGLRWLWLAAVVIVIDQLSKWLAVNYLSYNTPVAILPFFNLTLMHNTGAAFSFLAKNQWSLWFFGGFAVVISIFILFWLSRITSTSRWLSIALTFILGGALGNLIDRITHGYVIDFIQLYYHQWYWPTFNIADSAITIGAVMLAVEIIFDRKKD